MKTIVSINGKGGCGKSTLASNVAAGYARLGFRTLLLDMDPGSEMSEWFAKGNGIDTRNTIVTVLQGTQPVREVVQRTHLPNLWFIGSARALEHVTAQAENEEGYERHLARHLAPLRDDFDVVVIDAPNNISPAQNMTIFVADLFLVPFKDPSSVKRYPGVFQQMQPPAAEPRLQAPPRPDRPDQPARPARRGVVDGRPPRLRQVQDRGPLLRLPGEGRPQRRIHFRVSPRLQRGGGHGRARGGDAGGARVDRRPGR